MHESAPGTVTTSRWLLFWGAPRVPLSLCGSVRPSVRLFHLQNYPIYFNKDQNIPLHLLAENSKLKVKKCEKFRNRFRGNSAAHTSIYFRSRPHTMFHLRSRGRAGPSRRRAGPGRRVYAHVPRTGHVLVRLVPCIKKSRMHESSKLQLAAAAVVDTAYSL